MSDRLNEILPKERILTEEQMDRHTTFRTGGPARYFLVIETRKELAQVLAWLQEEALPWFLLGNGSNLLVGDRGYRGAILHLAGEFLKTEIDEATIRCGAGAMLSAVSRSAMEAGLTGLEFASGIPGTIGGAVRMNAGAYNGEIAGVTESVEVMEPAMALLWPFINFVMELMTISAPWSNGRMEIAVVNVLSIIRYAPLL